MHQFSIHRPLAIIVWDTDSPTGPVLIGEETEAERVQRVALVTQWPQDRPGFQLLTAPLLLSGDTMHVTISAIYSFTLPITRLLVLTIQLYIELHLHSRACTSQPWPVLQRRRKQDSPSTKTEWIKTLPEKSKKKSNQLGFQVPPDLVDENAVTIEAHADFQKQRKQESIGYCRCSPGNCRCTADGTRMRPVRGNI